MCAPIRPGLRLYQVGIKDGLLAVSSLFHRHDDDYTPKNVPGRYMVATIVSAFSVLESFCAHVASAVSLLFSSLL